MNSLVVIAVLAAICGTAIARVNNTEHTWYISNISLGLPKNAVLGGFDPAGYNTYIGRVTHGTDVLPARVVPELGLAYYNTQAVSNRVSTYQLLLSNSTVDYIWVRSFDGFLIPNSVSVGTSTSNERVYICRQKIDGGNMIGTLILSQKLCYIRHETLALRLFDKYEVLIAANKTSTCV